MLFLGLFDLLKAGFDDDYYRGYHGRDFGRHGLHHGYNDRHHYRRGHDRNNFNRCCEPKVYEKREEGYLVSDFKECGQAKTVGCESTVYERVRDDYKKGGEKKSWC